MRVILTTVFAAALGAGACFGASLQGTDIQGTYVEARTADIYTGPCFANGEAGIVGKRAVLGWKVERGKFEGVDLSGLGVVGVVRASDTLGFELGRPYPVKAVLIIDQKANPAQRTALRRFAQRMSGDLLSDVVRINYAPISLDIEGGNIHRAQAKLVAGELAKIETRSLMKGDEICTNEEVWYRPLAKVKHAMPAYTVANRFQGSGLDTRWSMPDERSSFVGEFHLQD